jgi:hypothetical protein
MDYSLERKSRNRIIIGTAIKIKINIPNSKIPSLCPACDSRDIAVALALGKGVAVRSSEGTEEPDERLKKVSKTKVINTPK